MIELVKKVKKIREKTGFLTGGGDGGAYRDGQRQRQRERDSSVDIFATTAEDNINNTEKEKEKKRDKLEIFESRMERLQEILHSSAECEFCVVTVPTEVAAAETKRLLDCLVEQDVLVRRVIMNQVLPSYVYTPTQEEVGATATTNNGSSSSSSSGGGEKFLDNLRKGQKHALADLQAMGLPLTEVRVYVDYWVMSCHGYLSIPCACLSHACVYAYDSHYFLNLLH